MDQTDSSTANVLHINAISAINTPREKIIVGPSLALYYINKRIFDLLLCSLFALLFWPLIVLIAIMVKLDSKGPAVYAQQRVGCKIRFINGVLQKRLYTFTFYKFRTLNQNSVEGNYREFIEAYIRNDIAKMFFLHKELESQESNYSKNGDTRSTRIGRFLRMTSLDELPQLWNIIKGDMSLVGPRPAIPYEVELYEPRHMKRLYTLPGLTGLWQTIARDSVLFEDMASLDIEYIDHQSFWLDMKILLATPKAVLSKIPLKQKPPIIKNKDKIHTQKTYSSSGNDPSKRTIEKTRLLLTAAFPRKFSKGLYSNFVIAIHPESSKDEVNLLIHQEFQKKEISQYSEETQLVAEKRVIVKLYNDDFEFSDPKQKELCAGINSFVFTGRPKNDSVPGKQAILLTIIDFLTQDEIISRSYEVEIVDFAFDHVSSYFAGKVTAIALALASVISFSLTTLAQIDTTAGVASGTAFLFLASLVFGRNHYFFKVLKRMQSVNMD